MASPAYYSTPTGGVVVGGLVWSPPLDHAAETCILLYSNSTVFFRNIPVISVLRFSPPPPTNLPTNPPTHLPPPHHHHPAGARGSGNPGPVCNAFGQNLDTPLEGPGVVEILGPYATLFGHYLDI